MILEVQAHRQLAQDLDAKRAEQLRRADAGELEKLRRSDRAGRDNDLAPCTRSLNAIASTVFDTRRFGALEDGLLVSKLRWARLASAFLLIPIIVPVILVGIGIFYAYVKLKLVNTLLGLVLAHSVLAIPLVVLVVTSALKSYDINQEMVARSLGASRPAAFLLVTLPQIRFGVISGAVLAFLTSFDEVVVALFVSGGENSTLTRTMFNALRDQIDPTIAAISTVMILVTSALLGLAQTLGRRET